MNVSSWSPTPGSTSRRRQPGAGVTARLLALVMLPVTAMCGLAGSAVLSNRSAEAQARTVDRGVEQLSELVSLGDALTSLEESARLDLRVVELGLNRSVATGALGFDWRDQDAPARAQADRAVSSLGRRSPVRLPVLLSLYADIDAGIIGPAASIRRLGEHRGAIDSASATTLASLEADVDHGPLRGALRSLEATIGMRDVAGAQAGDFTGLWFPTPGATPQTTATVHARLNAETDAYAAASAQIRQFGAPSVVAGLRRIEADPQVQRFDRAVTSNLAPVAEAGPALAQGLADSRDPLDIDSLAATFRGHLKRDELLGELVATATTATRSEAEDLSAAHRSALITAALAAATLALASIGIAVWLARSISNPLRDLAGYAHAINDGQLDTETPSSSDAGPRETRVAFGAFAGLVANLQLLDAKANALARCDFEDPALREPLPGRLGQSLESSVTLLSGSIVERDELHSHLAHQATHDALTGIGNRPAAVAALQAAINRAARTGATTALLFVDLNEFKAVNDSHGHEAGDEVLRQVASRLSLSLRSGDSVARLGGDEFVIIAEGVTDVADATDLAQRVIDTIGQPIEIGAARVSIGAAVGIAMSLDGPEEPLRLLARADAAMYRAKHHDRSAIEIFDADLQRQLLEREEIGAALAVALADPAGGGLRLHYQPVLDAASDAMVGAEALIRWDRPGQGLLAPDSFIPVAERTALIIDLDCWVLAEAARQLVAWSSIAELAEVPVAVNISGRHLLSRQLPGHLREVLDATGIDPQRLSIEITETVLLADLASAATELDAVRAMGISVAIDDFGTGYTSLAHLQQLPIDTIKIDRSFISQLNAKRGSSLVRMVTDLGHAIDVSIVAEGVETGEEMSALQAMGADHLQGFLLCRPLEPAALSTWAHERAATTCPPAAVAR